MVSYSDILATPKPIFRHARFKVVKNGEVVCFISDRQDALRFAGWVNGRIETNLIVVK